MGITAALTLSAAPERSEKVSNQELADAADQYICANYNNCGLCGGKCSLKNPETPGLTPEQKKEAEEWQKKHKEKQEEKKKHGDTSADEDAEILCNAKQENTAKKESKQSSKMKAKRGLRH